MMGLLTSDAAMLIDPILEDMLRMQHSLIEYANGLDLAHDADEYEATDLPG